MKRPKRPGTAINARRFQAWLANFQGYRAPVTQPIIEFWLAQFKVHERDTAARVLDAVLFYNQSHIHSSFRNLLKSLPGWHRRKSDRVGKWFFVAFSRTAGESGDAMTHAFRMANGMSTRHWDNLFIQRSEIVQEALGPEDTVVLIDDFAGTGSQACGSWKDPFSEILASGPKVYLMLVAATFQAVRKIRDETEMELVCEHVLKPKDNIFSNECRTFTNREKSMLLKHCKVADKGHPKGYGDCGLLFVLSHQTPNNSLPIFTACEGDWDGIFPRA